MEQVRTWFPTVVLVSAVYAGLTALFSFLLIIGVSCEVSSLITLSQNASVRTSSENMTFAGAVPDDPLPDPEHGGHHPVRHSRHRGGRGALPHPHRPRRGQPRRLPCQYLSIIHIY